MSGWKIKFQNKDINISPKFGVTLMMSNRNNDMTNISLVGLDQQKSTYRWIDSIMETGDMLELDVTEIKQQTSPISINEVSSKIETPVTEERDEMWNEKLLEYYDLEKLLKNEGLISE